jgi:hypothetical protein
VAISPVDVSLTTSNPTVRKGHPVRVTMTMTDVSNAPVTLPGGGAAEFTLIKGSTPIWHRVVSSSSVHPRTLEPGQSIELSAIWNGKAPSAGVPLTAGSYTLTASDGGYSGSTTLHLTG